MRKIAFFLCLVFLLNLFVPAALAASPRPYDDGKLQWGYNSDGTSASIYGILDARLCTETELTIPSYIVDEQGRSVPVTKLIYNEARYSYSFKFVPGLETVHIPNTVTEIGRQVFADCKSLSSVEFGATSRLTAIGASAFARCTSLGYIEFPSGLTSIGGSAFINTQLEYMDLSGTNVTTIEGKAFYDSWLHEIQLPMSIRTISGPTRSTPGARCGPSIPETKRSGIRTSPSAPATICCRCSMTGRRSLTKRSAARLPPA